MDGLGPAVYARRQLLDQPVRASKRLRPDSLLSNSGPSERVASTKTGEWVVLDGSPQYSRDRRGAANAAGARVGGACGVLLPRKGPAWGRNNGTVLNRMGKKWS